MAKPNYVSVTSDKSRKGAFFRCLFGGWFGWHYLYVGRTFRGLICLFPLLGNFCLVGNIIDLWKISHGTFKDNVGQYLRQ